MLQKEEMIWLYYHDIAADIRTQISHGKYEKNQKLPKQTELAITYKTSRVNPFKRR